LGYRFAWNEKKDKILSYQVVDEDELTTLADERSDVDVAADEVLALVGKMVQFGLASASINSFSSSLPLRT
jgi:hypothetical protein